MTIAASIIGLLTCLMSFGAGGPALAQSSVSEIDEHAVIQKALQPVEADLDLILERRLLRVAIPYTPIYFSYNGDKVIGFAVEIARELEGYLGRTFQTKVDVLLIPLPRDQIIPAVVDGRADIAMANLTVTESRQAQVDFADPIFTDISEIVVTGPASQRPDSFDDLVGQGVFLRPSSSYFAHLRRKNSAREAAGKAPVPITEVPPHLEDYDILDLLDKGVVPATVVDSHKLKLWQQIFDNIEVHEALTVNEGGEIAWAVRKGSPELLNVLNAFIPEVKQGTLLGNILSERYFQSTGWIDGIRGGDMLRARKRTIEAIRTYAGEYGFDWRLIFAQAYQESRLDQSTVSNAGAVGVMQILPDTARDSNVAIPEIRTLEGNVHAGIKYLSFIRGRYFDDPEIAPHDRTFLSLAAYNAGPNGIARARREAERMGLDPNVWFANVEIAAARTIGREPIIYVRNIYKNFVSFGLISGKAKPDPTETLDGGTGDAPATGRSGAVWMLSGLFLTLLCAGAAMTLLRRSWRD